MRKKGPSKETPGLVPDSAPRPADVLLPNWTNGHSLDVHVISPLQSLTMSEAARTQGKLASNLPNCRSMGLTCIPLVAEKPSVV